jgi:uncharacterized repeat protein (TIGR03803 family)
MRFTSRSARLASILAVVATAVALVPVARGATKYKVLHNFGSGSDGTFPSGPLLLGKKGSLFGVTYDGGTGSCSDYGCGVLFMLAPQADGKWSEAVLHDFAGGSDGASPDGGLIFDGAGNLYGTLGGDGSVDVAGVFELSRGDGGWSNTVLYSDNSGPGLVWDKLGNLYGEIGPGDYFHVGAIGELLAGSKGWAYAQLYSFCSQDHCDDGYGPPAPPIWDDHGNLYGTTSDGGVSHPKCGTSSGCGVVFKMTPNGDSTWTYDILHRFASFATDGQTPSGGLVMDGSGNLYGDTLDGGSHGNGTIFRFAPAAGGGWKQTVLYDFPSCADGCLPTGTLVFDKDGNLYGAAGGGIPDCAGFTCGVVFKLTSQKNGKWSYSVLHKFTLKDGAFPQGVTLDERGNIFGTTLNGGAHNDAGVAFEITP